MKVRRRKQKCIGQGRINNTVCIVSFPNITNSLLFLRSKLGCGCRHFWVPIREISDCQHIPKYHSAAPRARKPPYEMVGKLFRAHQMHMTEISKLNNFDEIWHFILCSFVQPCGNFSYVFIDLISFSASARSCLTFSGLLSMPTAPMRCGRSTYTGAPPFSLTFSIIAYGSKTTQSAIYNNGLQCVC